MYTTQTRVHLAHQRAQICKKRWLDDCIVKLSVVSVAIFGLDLAMILYISEAKRYHSPEHWLYGATLLPNDAGGYVLVAIVAFVIAVAITILCMKRHEKEKQQEEKR